MMQYKIFLPPFTDLTSICEQEELLAGLFHSPDELQEGQHIHLYVEVKTQTGKYLQVNPEFVIEKIEKIGKNVANLHFKKAK